MVQGSGHCNAPGGRRWDGSNPEVGQGSDLILKSKTDPKALLCIRSFSGLYPKVLDNSKVRLASKLSSY